ncbi:putative protease YdcP precursor [Clostridium homopropionicum DSM 5847]|uniref:Putative protease YdcP n=1 Tax=Clostridium homopropionicum DSM 5847 TaxID=1121318 RepID=A0A0L6ZBB3_9CLOT|nr:U32 family peptidase [Clostridium homopropionicum]KOA20256.1 putative protease YdcP precursor [Clostridium homopropionicum DSM 5847]SFG57403.1 putative protease [Clostridium homopropionicum]
MKKIELLAPAGSMESLYAAVQNGADAIYIGGNKFSARAYASNFNEEEMIKAVSYCHLYNIKVYVTLNILIKEEEIVEALEYVKLLYEIGIDALIIQDFGLAQLIGKNFPNFEIHASTQMTVHNGEGALFLKELGFKRIVLARELSLKEIERISKGLMIETEIFIHGALCICYSGQCLMSSIIGGRSGNRGRCAQPCRLPYEIINKENNEIKKGYIMSPKDICTLENIEDIIDSGTSSLKIEGRMKRPEYVAGVVSTYRKAIDGNLRKENVSTEKKKLTQLFNREGFSNAYLYGNPGKELMSYGHPRNTGILLGKVNKDHTIRLEENIKVKDGVRSEDKGFTISKIEKNNIEVDEAYIGEIVKIKPVNYKAGDVLYKTLDISLMDELSNTYKDIYHRKNKINLEVTFKIGEPFILRGNYKDKTYEVCGEKVQKPLKKGVDKENLIRNLNKTGDTPFSFESINFIEFEEGFIPISLINSCRRELLDKITKDIISKDSRKHIESLDFNIEKVLQKNNVLNSTIVLISSTDHLRAVEKFKIENVAVDIFMKNCNVDIKNIKDKKVYLRIPTIVRNEFEYICAIIEENICNICGIITSNLGIIKKFSGSISIIGDYKLNIFNSYALNSYSDYIEAATLSLELNKKEIQSLLSKTSIRPYQLIYGKPELMVNEYCPIGSLFGKKDSIDSNCTNACEKGQFILKDRKETEFRILTDKFCRSHLYNPVAINLIPNLQELRKLKIDSFRIDFTDETYEEAVKILKTYMDEKFDEDFKNYTRGHFKRGVE